MQLALASMYAYLKIKGKRQISQINFVLLFVIITYFGPGDFGSEFISRMFFRGKSQISKWTRGATKLIAVEPNQIFRAY